MGRMVRAARLELNRKAESASAPSPPFPFTMQCVWSIESPCGEPLYSVARHTLDPPALIRHAEISSHPNGTCSFGKDTGRRKGWTASFTQQTKRSCPALDSFFHQGYRVFSTSRNSRIGLALSSISAHKLSAARKYFLVVVSSAYPDQQNVALLEGLAQPASTAPHSKIYPRQEGGISSDWSG